MIAWLTTIDALLGHGVEFINQSLEGQYHDLDMCYTLLSLIYFNISFTHRQIQPTTCLMNVAFKEYSS